MRDRCGPARTGTFYEHAAVASEFSGVRTMAWDSPGHLPWLAVATTPCPGNEPRSSDNHRPRCTYQCQLRHVHVGLEVLR